MWVAGKLMFVLARRMTEDQLGRFLMKIDRKGITAYCNLSLKYIYMKIRILIVE